MNPDGPHILVIDDDQRLRARLQKYLMAQGFLVSTASSAADAEAKLKSLVFDLMIVDVMMPGEDGMSFTRRIRQGAGIPIIMLTARDMADDRVAGLEVGADDYLSKPFEPRELVLRMRNALRLVPPPPEQSGVLAFGPFTFDRGRLELFRGGRPVPLTDSETSLLAVFAGSPGVTMSRFRLAQKTIAAERTIDVQVSRLRRKIEHNPGEPQYLRTIRGKGYVLVTS